ncbi:MAG: hypothetical protein NVSMB21_07190 [Vulcanimicrobiaceae bacterium]
MVSKTSRTAGAVPDASATRRDARLDGFCELAAGIAGVPVAYICISGDEGCRIVGARGYDPEALSRANVPCRHVIVEGVPVVVPDIRRDDRLEGSGAYGGFALVAASGERLGTLNVEDARARAFHAAEISGLERLVESIVDYVELRRLRDDDQSEDSGDARRVAALERGTRELEAEIEQRKRAEERLTFAAYHDQLTRLANRAYLERRLEECVAAAHEHESTRRACVLFIDLDRFKRINDRLGHLAGDLLLTLVARRLERSVRPGDVVARLGGDEFMILLEGLGDIGEAEELAKRILATLAAPYRLQRSETFVTVSIGVALIDGSTDSPSDVLREADIAMYRAKEKGRNRVAVFQPYLRERDIAIATLESDLRIAWEHRQFFLAYQPIVSLKTDSLVGFEALLRWKHPERGIVLPREFIAATEEIGMIVPLGEMVISEACRQLHRFQSDPRGSRALTMSVNLSSMQLGSHELVEHVDRAIKLSEISPQSFVIELTESVILEDFTVAAEVLGRLRELGVRIHMDDFGTGYSSLNYLRQLPIDQIKIDRVFVSGEHASLQDPEIVDTIVSLAHKLGIAAIAEGVETEAQLRELTSLGCDAAQGFLYSPAVVPLEAGGMLGALRLGGASALRHDPTS